MRVAVTDRSPFETAGVEPQQRSPASPPARVARRSDGEPLARPPTLASDNAAQRVERRG